MNNDRPSFSFVNMEESISEQPNLLMSRDFADFSAQINVWDQVFFVTALIGYTRSVFVGDSLDESCVSLEL